MKKSIKSALLSALVFPGAGHFFLKKFLRGTVLMVLSLAGLAFIVVKTVEKALAIVDKLQSGQVPPEAQALTALRAKASPGPDALFLDIATYGITLCWLIGIIDSYRIGNRQDRLSR